MELGGARVTSEISLAFSHPADRAEATSGPNLLDRISLRDHIREVEIGAFQAERGTTQRICFNVVVEVRIPDGLDDDVDKILSYDVITDAIDRELSAERLNLLETLAERVAESVLQDPRAARVFVRIEKLDRGPGALGVEIVRDRQAVSVVTEEDFVIHPLVVYLGNDVLHHEHLAHYLDVLSETNIPLVLCVAECGVPAPEASHPAAQRRIDLLAIEQNAWVLAARDKRCVVVSTRTELDWAMKHDQISVWAPSKIVLDATDGPDLSQMKASALANWFAEEFQAASRFTLSDAESGPGQRVSGQDLLSDNAAILQTLAD